RLQPGTENLREVTTAVQNQRQHRGGKLIQGQAQERQTVVNEDQQHQRREGTEEIHVQQDQPVQPAMLLIMQAGNHQTQQGCQRYDDHRELDGQPQALKQQGPTGGKNLRVQKSIDQFHSASLLRLDRIAPFQHPRQMNEGEENQAEQHSPGRKGSGVGDVGLDIAGHVEQLGHGND